MHPGRCTGRPAAGGRYLNSWKAGLHDPILWGHDSSTHVLNASHKTTQHRIAILPRRTLEDTQRTLLAMSVATDNTCVRLALHSSPYSKAGHAPCTTHHLDETKSRMLHDAGLFLSSALRTLEAGRSRWAFRGPWSKNSLLCMWRSWAANFQ